MVTSITFALIDRLIDVLATGLPGVRVLDGDVVSGDAGDYLAVGWEDPDSDRSTSATAQQGWNGLGAKSRRESGSVTCLALSWNGDPAGLKAARDAVQAMTATVENLLRAEPNLGGIVPGLLWTSYGTRTDLKQWLSAEGSVAVCTFEIAFEAKI
ncbi:hypothetical protein [Pimelobacter simplex]|uniref:hypothetical protein n=1 Tax=Nocardioides simplex TaxID=2045 RepID=UPI003AAF53C1